MKGVEVGSVARAAKPFLVQEIQFDIKANHIPGCVVSVGIYRIEGKEDVFTPVLHKPIYVKIPESGEPPLFLKRSYLRHAAVGQFDRISFNIGMGVKGLEFR